MGSAGPPSSAFDVDDVFDLGTLLKNPEEQGPFECSIPEEFQGDPDGEGAPPRPIQPLKASCLRDFRAVRTSGTRQLTVIRWIVLHSTEGETARGSASWHANPNAKGSAHLHVDDRECYRTLTDDVIPWGAPGANTMGWHIEHAGRAANGPGGIPPRWTREKWLSHKETLRRGAFKSARHAVKFGIPIKLLTTDELRAGKKGFITHAMCSKVFGGDHSDPGSNFPLDVYMEFAKQFAAEV